MESSSSRQRAAKEDDHLASLRRINNRLIIILFCLLILIGLTGAVVLSLLRMQYNETYGSINSNSAVESFCSYTIYPSDCGVFFNSVIKSKSRIDPNELFTISLQTAVRQLKILSQLITNTESTDTQTKSAFKNCSNLVQKSLSHLSQSLSLFRVNPDVKRQTEEQRNNMTNWTIAAEQDLGSCYDYLTKIESSAGEIRGRAHEVLVQASNSAHFLRNYRSVFYYLDNGSGRKYGFDLWDSIAWINSGLYIRRGFGAFMFALQYLFVIVLVCTLYRLHWK